MKHNTVFAAAFVALLMAGFMDVGSKGAEGVQAAVLVVQGEAPERIDWTNASAWLGYNPPPPIFIPTDCREAGFVARKELYGIEVQPIWVGATYDKHIVAMDFATLIASSTGVPVRQLPWMRMVDAHEAWAWGDRQDEAVVVIVDAHSIWQGELEESPAPRHPVMVGGKALDKVLYNGAACGDTIIIDHTYPCRDGLVTHEFGHVLGLWHDAGGVMENVCKHAFFSGKGKAQLDDLWGHCTGCGPWWSVNESQVKQDAGH